MEKLDQADPIWGQPSETYRIGPDDYSFANERTGKFVVPLMDFSDFIQPWSAIQRAKISTWVLEQNRAGIRPRLTPQDIKSIEQRRPLNIGEKIDRFLLMLESMSYRPGDPLPWSQGLASVETVALADRTKLWIEAASETEYNAFRDILVDAGIINIQRPERVRLDFAAHERMDKIRSGTSDIAQAFVAMWFSPIMDEAYARGIEPALLKAGYHAQRIDRKEHANKIDDEIIAEIKRSKFMVADFTCELVGNAPALQAVARGGVYYEAGYAQGLGLPVIWSVRADLVAHVHFDTRQYNHIVWNDPAELEGKLFNRVAAVIGERGSLTT